MEILPRSAWDAAPPKSRTDVRPSLLKGVTVHWFGSPTAADTHEGCPRLLRAVQRAHMAPGGLGVPTGGADIAYNHACCPHGVLYTLRGFGVRTGANGSTAGNATHCAIVYMAGTGDPFTAPAKVGLNFLIEEWRRRGAGREVSPHSRWTGSSCPGPDVHAWLAAGRPVEKEEVVQDWVPKFIHWYLFDRPRNVPKPDDIPDGPYSEKIWAVIDMAARYRAEKPNDDSEANLLRGKIAAAITALS